MNILEIWFESDNVYMQHCEKYSSGFRCQIVSRLPVCVRDHKYSHF